MFLTTFMRRNRVRLREFDGLDRLDVAGDGRGDVAVLAHEVLHELRHAAAERQSEHVMQDQHLAVGIAAGADADHRDLHGPGNARGQFAGDAFEQQHGGAGCFQRLGVLQHLLCLGFFTPCTL